MGVAIELDTLHQCLVTDDGTEIAGCLVLDPFQDFALDKDGESLVQPIEDR